jgi:K(+)-stimulated pyrophosphate-energized sodium pump
MISSAIFWIVPVAALCALLFAWIFYRSMKAQEEGTDRMKEIAGYVREGAMAYLRRQYTVVGKVFVVLVVLLTILAYFGIQNPFVPFAFLTGGIFSGLCGFLGMKTATYASNRTAWAASKSLNKGLQVALRSGAVMGLVVVGFGLARHCSLVPSAQRSHLHSRAHGKRPSFSWPDLCSSKHY